MTLGEALMATFSNTKKQMKAFWNEKAKENPYFYVSSFQDYSQPDPEEFFRWGERLALQHLRETPYTPSGNESMLEIGCGIGRMARTFASLFREVHAVDVSKEMMERARSVLAEFPNVFLYESDGAGLAMFTDRKFDFCYSYLVFQHLPRPELILNYIREVGRVLKPGGVFRFQLDTSLSRGRLFRVALKARGELHDYVTRLIGRSRPTGLHRPSWIGSQLSAVALKSVLSEAGLSLQNLEGVGTQYTWVTALRTAAEKGNA